MIIRPLTIMAEKSIDPLNPLGLPPYTIRLKYSDGVTPTFNKGTGVQVSSSPNIWDLTYENSNWTGIFRYHSNLLEVLGANTTGVTNMNELFNSCSLLTTVHLFDTSNVTTMYEMFYYCRNLITVPLFDTSNVTDMSQMFLMCNSLTSVQLFNTSNATNMSWMFGYSYNVENGALALYQQASSQANPPSSHYRTFYECGRDTITGSAELSQIPSDWK